METVIGIWNNFDTQLHALICKKTNHQDHCHDILQDLYIKMIENIDILYGLLPKHIFSVKSFLKGGTNF